MSEWIEVSKIAVSALKEVAWPIAVGAIAFAYRSDIHSLLPRVRKAGLSGVELDPIHSQQKIAESTRPPGQLKPLPGFNRTKAIEEIEKNLHMELNEIQDEDKIDVVVRVLAQSRLETLFERIYRVIFGSQIAGLERLSELDSVTIDEARSFFEPLKDRHPEIYTEYGFHGWVGFLKNEKFITLADNRISITELGRDFIKYLNARNLPKTKAF